MEMYLQFGYGMMEHCRHLLDRWNGGTVILSPRDLTDEQLSRLAADINAIDGGHVLLDPQFYLPNADHDRLCSHGFWPSDYDSGTFWQGPGAANLIAQLVELNDRLSTTSFVVPGLLAPLINEDWLVVQRSLIEEARSQVADRQVMATIALSADATRNEEHIGALLEDAPSWEVGAYYVVCEHPNGDYLVQDPIWMANVLDITAGLRLTGAQVVLGYCNHQMLVAGAARATAICSGTWMNVRSFPPDKFRAVYDEEIRQRATWYYCPQSLSEYKLPFLDIAQRQGLLDRLAPLPDLDGGYAAALFAGAQPTSVGFSEQAAFRHYLHALRGQAATSEGVAFDTALSQHEEILTNAEQLISTLARAGVRGQNRDFADIIDVNRAALAVLNTTRGPVLRRRWDSL